MLAVKPDPMNSSAERSDISNSSELVAVPDEKAALLLNMIIKVRRALDDNQLSPSVLLKLTRLKCPNWQISKSL